MIVDRRPFPWPALDNRRSWTSSKRSARWPPAIRKSWRRSPTSSTVAGCGCAAMPRGPRLMCRPRRTRRPEAGARLEVYGWRGLDRTEPSHQGPATPMCGALRPGRDAHQAGCIGGNHLGRGHDGRAHPGHCDVSVAHVSPGRARPGCPAGGATCQDRPRPHGCWSEVHGLGHDDPPRLGPVSEDGDPLLGPMAASS